MLVFGGIELSLGRTQLRLGTSEPYLIPWAVVVPLASGAVLGVFAGSAMAAWESVAARNIPLLALASSVTTAAAGALVVFLCSLRLDGTFGPAAAERNFLASSGLALVAFWLLGDRLAWLLPSAFALLTLAAGVSNGRPSPWAFILLQGSDGAAAAAAGIVFVLGIGTSLVRQPPSAQLASLVRF